jgi:sensor histidine kinase YesM
MRLRNLTIKTKLILFCFVLVILVSSIFLYSNRNTSSILSVFTSNQETYYAVNSLSMTLRECRELLLRYLSSPESESLEEFYSLQAKANELLVILSRKADSKEEIFRSRALSNLCSVYFEGCNRTLEVSQRTAANPYPLFYEGDTVLNYIYQYTGEYLQHTLTNDKSSYHILQARGQRVETISYLMLIFIVTLCSVFTFIFSSYIANPINELIEISRNLSKGDLDVKQIEIKYYNEVGVLVETFNQMSENIRNLVHDLENKNEVEALLLKEELKNSRMEEMLKEARFLALQSQINPHFLFNTLNTISRSVNFAPPEVTIKLIHSLSQLFRYNLEHNEKCIFIEEELEIVRKYLFIQEFRFQDRLSVSIDADPLCNKILIPKLTLQPLVENSLIHGLEPTDRKGTIHIQVKRRGENILIRVFDNGVGISKKRIDELLNPGSLNHPGPTTSVGLGNIISRIEFLNRGLVRIISKPDCWTMVCLSIPYPRTELCIQY